MAIQTRFAGGCVGVSTGTANVTTAITGTGNDGAAVYGVTLVAKENNAGKIWIGGEDVSTAAGDGLNPGQTITWEWDRRYIHTQDIYIIVAVTGDGVDFYGNTA